MTATVIPGFLFRAVIAMARRTEQEKFTAIIFSFRPQRQSEHPDHCRSQMTARCLQAHFALQCKSSNP
jgi:hypothetical protein